MPDQIINQNANGSIDIHVGQDSMATEQARNIVGTELPDWLNLFLRKNAQYAELAETTLGPKGMFVDIWRKVNVLKRVIWDGGPAATESTDEVILDLIGHLFLILEHRHRVAIKPANIHVGAVTMGKLSAIRPYDPEVYRP